MIKRPVSKRLISMLAQSEPLRQPETPAPADDERDIHLFAHAINAYVLKRARERPNDFTYGFTQQTMMPFIKQVTTSTALKPETFKNKDRVKHLFGHALALLAAEGMPIAVYTPTNRGRPIPQKNIYIFEIDRQMMKDDVDPIR